MYNTIFLIFGILVLLIFLLSISIIHIRSLRDDLDNRWYNLAEKLQYRQDLIPNLIETIRLFVPAEKISLHNDILQKTIEQRSAAAKHIKPGSEKIIIEHELSRHLEELIQLGALYNSLAKSTNYLELKKEFKDLRAGLDNLTRDYNSRVRSYNSILSRPYNKPASLLMKYKNRHIFEFE